MNAGRAPDRGIAPSRTTSPSRTRPSSRCELALAPRARRAADGNVRTSCDLRATHHAAWGARARPRRTGVTRIPETNVWIGGSAPSTSGRAGSRPISSRVSRSAVCTRVRRPDLQAARERDSPACRDRSAARSVKTSDGLAAARPAARARRRGDRPARAAAGDRPRGPRAGPSEVGGGSIVGERAAPEQAGCRQRPATASSGPIARRRCRRRVDADEVLGVARALVAARSENPGGTEDEAAAVAAEVLAGARCRSGGRPRPTRAGRA